MQTTFFRETMCGDYDCQLLIIQFDPMPVCVLKICWITMEFNTLSRIILVLNLNFNKTKSYYGVHRTIFFSVQLLLDYLVYGNASAVPCLQR